MHARIENYTSQKKPIFTQKEWVQHIKNCKVNNPYTVLEKEQKDIFNFEELSEKMNWHNVMISKVREFHVKPKKLTIFFKYGYLDPLISLNIFKRGVSMSDIKEMTLKQAYVALKPLTKRKKDDFQKMLDKGLIPYQFCKFYTDLININ